MCHKCYCTINNMNSSKTTTSLAIFVNWLPHEKNCITCQMAEEVQNGTVSTRLIKKKAKTPKNKLLVPRKFNKCWTIAMFNSIKENLFPIHNIDINILELKNDLNPFLELCLCSICYKIPQTPVTLKRCEHLFCFFCLAKEMKISYIDETFCPKCKEKIYYNDLLNSKQTDTLFKMLTLVCVLCNTKFNALKEYEFYLVHKSKCDKENTSLQSSPATSPKSISISDVFKINKDNIPQELEEAALHIITLKMEKSGENVAEFK